MKRRLLQSTQRALVILVLVVVAPVGFGCQMASCHTTGEPSTMQVRQADEPIECPERVESNVEESRQAAIRRASSFLELVEYEPASLGPSKALAILSYPQAEASLGQRSFVYDDALALLWFAWTGQQDLAGGLAETLIYLQNPDGSWGFSFDTNQAENYHASYVRNGAVAWAAHALGYFGRRFAKPRAIRAASRGASFLRRMRLGSDGLGRGLVSAGYGTPSTPPHAPVGPTLEYAVAEHQFDAHMVLAEFEPRSARRLAERILEVLWIDQEGRFGVAATGDGLNTRRALDAAGAWGALWLLSVGEPDRAERSYRYALEHFQSDAQLFGFRPYEDSIDGYDPSRAGGHIFVEGTMGMGLAAHRLGDDVTAKKVIETGVELSCLGGPGLAYSTEKVPGFSTRPAAASTLWFLFVEREISGGQVAPLFDSPLSDSPVMDTTG
jgi:hypothetical protein